MRNYAEEIAYWYYRLNHFFILQNFVMHQVEERGHKRVSAETDILAIKPPYATESIPTDPHYELKPDRHLVALLGFSPERFDEFAIYVMAEVTSGGSKQRSKFDFSRVEYNLKRFGLNKILDASHLEGTPIKRIDNTVVCKIFMDIDGTKLEKGENFFKVPLKHADGFVDERMSKEFKGRDWCLFNSNYIQSKIMFRPPKS